MPANRTINYKNNTRKCSKCKDWLSFVNFWQDKNNTTGFFSKCITCEKKIRNKNEYKTYRKQYEQTEHYKKYQNNYEKFKRIRTNKDKESRRKRDKKYRENPLFVLKQNCSRYIRQKLKEEKSQKTVKYLGCSIQNLKWWLEFWFEPNMTWCNYGNKEHQWSIDHIIPTGPAKTKKQLIPLLNYKNLQPMWHIDNVKKSDKIHD